MKKILLYGLKKRMGRHADPYRKKKFIKKMIFLAGFAFLFLVVLGGVAIWGAVTLVSQLSASVQTEQAKDLVEEGQNRVKEFGSKPLVSQTCLDTISSLTFSPTRWLTVPLAQNLNLISTHCLGNSEPANTAQPSQPAEKGSASWR